MFGGNSSWTNPQQNQQQQQQQPGPSAFGQQQPNAFGSGGTGAFGGGAFGQNSQQQPPVNPMFGGTTNTANTTGTFGGGGTTAFGAPKPSGFGAFGGGGNTGTSTFGSGGAFGQTNTPATASTSAFGQPAGGTNAFGGAGTGLFGQKPAAPTGAFGSTSTGPTPGTGDVSVAPVTTGSANPPYSVFSEKDTNGPGNVTLNYQSISTMPAYRGTSFEELRVQDYAQGRKTAGGFGQSATFGLAPSQSSTTAFGQPAASTSTFGGFGQSNQQPATQPTNAFGSFGQPAAAQPPAFGSGTGTTFGSFGQSTQPQQQQPQQPAGSGLFGGAGAFGQNTQQQPQTGTSAFGGFGQNNSTQPKPFGTFGQTTSTNAFGSGGGFGQSGTQPASQPTGGLFGQPANQNQGATAFGSFGTNNNNALKPAFGQPASQPTTTGFGLFGQNSQQQQPNQPQAQQPSTGLFGGGGTSTGTGLFGQNTQQQQGQPGQQNTAQPSTGLFGQPAAQPSNNLFGGGGTGTSLFGNNNQSKPGFGGGIFGTNNNQPANSGTGQPSTGIFGQPLGQSTAQSAPGTNAFGGTSLFGQKPATTNVFGQSTTQPTSTGMGSSLFGNSTLGGPGGGFGQSMAGTGGAQGAGTLTASVAQPVQENLPIFSLLHSNTQAASLAPPPKKMSNFFVDVPTRSPLGISSARLSNGGKLRGFGVSQSAAGLNRNGGLSATMTLSKNAPNSLALSRGDSRSLLGPDSFLGSPSLGSDGKSSPKKLVLHKKIDPSEVFGRSMAKAAASSGSKVAFNPAMSMAAREKEAFSMPAVSKPMQPTSPATASSGRKSMSLEKDPSELQEGDYYVKPPLDVLRKLSNRELSAFEGLIVGRKGYGEVHFLDPVDLTALPKLKDLLGKLVEIDNKEVCVYPDSALVEEKPPPGEGINVRARISLAGCWPKDKASGESLKDDKSPVFAKHLKKLKNIKRTHFESYDVKTGTWVFVVDHF